MLHDLPPPGTGVQDDSFRRRRGYIAVRDNDGGPVDEVLEEEEQNAEERDAVRKEGWLALGWSFSASALLTVN